MDKIKVAVDLDGVIYNWGDTVRYLIKHKYDIDLPASTHWTFVQENVPEHAWKWLWASGEEMGMFKYGSLIKGSVEGLKSLSRLNCDLVVATHRPAWAIPDTCDLIRRLPNVFSGLHFLTNQESKRIAGADVYIDDNPAVVDDIYGLGADMIVFDQPWNQRLNSPHTYRAFGWEQVPDLVSKSIEKRQLVNV